MSNDILKQLRRPFHPSQITWKPGVVKGERALALAYADLRAYMNRLDEVCGIDWVVTYEPWGESRIICRLTICGITRSSTGESSAESEKSEIGGTVAEAQSMKRAAAMFGLGRYLYSLPTGWADFDPKTKQFTPQAKSKLTQMLVQHYRRATEGDGDAERALEDAPQTTEAPESFSEAAKAATALIVLQDQFNTLGSELYGEQWPQVREHNVKRISEGKTSEVNDLSAEQLQKLIDGMTKLKGQRQVSQN